MLKASRSLCLDICDYEDRKICNLYDNTADVSGQATDVFVKTERNGWKELSFTIPSTCITDEGEEENYRLQYLIADYKIRLQTDDELDWYIISEQKITHDKKAKTVEVTAGHIAQLLKTKNLDLEFSDEEGNNTGTAKEILTTILEGTGWHVGDVADFVEDNDPTESKRRSLNASSNTGAFRLIEELCELFDAKPIYHGYGTYLDAEGMERTGRVVDIVPMNPFSEELEPGQIPKEVYHDINVLEIHYDKNLKNISRTVNTDTLVTRLYAYGSYGDENGMCSIQTCYHDEYKITSGNYDPGTEFVFSDKDGAPYYFTADERLTAGMELIYSKLDFMSRSYVWNKTTQRAYLVYKQRNGEPEELTAVQTEAKNYFPFLLGFDYYLENGLLSDNLFQRLATYQQSMPSAYIESENAAKQMIENEQLLSEILESNTGMAKLAVKSYDQDEEGKLVLNLDTNSGDHGVLYRTDYDEAKRNYFSWHVAKQLKDNGDPVSGIGSVVYIVHHTNPITWDIAYVKKILDDKGNVYLNDSGNPKDYDYGLNDTEPSGLVLHMDKGNNVLFNSDRFYLFCSMSMSGKLAAKQVSDEAVLTSLQNETTIATEKHPTYFGDATEPAPSITPIQSSYGWYYKFYSRAYDPGELFFCYGARGENAWHKVFVEETTPYVQNDSYYFNIRSKVLYHGEDNFWVKMETAEEQRIAIQFSKVIYYCKQRDMLYKGIYEKYVFTTTEKLNKGNYAIKSPYDFFWVTTTDEDIPSGYNVTIDTTKGYMWQNDSLEKVVPTKVVSYETADFPVENEVEGLTLFPGRINTNTGVEESSSSWYRTINIKVYKETQYEYNLPEGSYIVVYNIDKVFQHAQATSGSGVAMTQKDAYYMRVVIPQQLSPEHYIRIKGYNNKLYLSNKEYTIIDYAHGDSTSELLGIGSLMVKFADTADLVYEQNLLALTRAQEFIKSEDANLTEKLGDLLREGYWQEDQFVEGDEIRMYTDAIDNLKEISKPEITYEIDFLDLYGSNRGLEFSVDDVTEIDWPDIQITDAVHLVDSDANINQWAYIDVVNKCYDQPWKTTLEINTKLSLIDQHSFTDVLSRIAEVAKESKGKQSIYKRAAALSSSGKLSSDLLDGNIKANKAFILGGASNWWTDPKGNFVFEADDGSGAMMLTGRGILIADQRDSWGDWMFRTGLTGKGITADEVVTAFLSAKEALIGAITTDMIHASVGQELEIGSNAALMMYATIDGSRPAGGLKTGLHNSDGSFAEVGENDSYIQIGCSEIDGSKKDPAFINIMTGGMLNVYSGSDMNIKSGADLYIESEGHFEVQSGGDLKIASGGSIDIIANEAGHFTVQSPNFNVDASGNTDITGCITALTGEIAGLTVNFEEKDGEVVRRYMFAGTDSMTSTAPGVYIGTDGVNLGGYLTVSKDGAQAKFGTNTLNIDAVSGQMNINGGDINVTANSTFNISAGKQLVLASSGNVVIGNTGKAFTVGSDGENAYIYNGPSQIGAAVDGAYFGTDGIYIRGVKDTKVNYFKATNTGDIDMTGNITARSGSIGGINIDEAYGIYTGTKTSATASENGFLIHKDGSIYLGKFDSLTGVCPFQVTSAGSLTATSGTIGGWTINATSLTGSVTGLAKTAADTDIAFWAGSATPSSSNFYVQQNGRLFTKNIDADGGTIGTWAIDEKKIYAGSGGSYVGLDGSTDLYPLSGLSSPDAYMYAFWAGAKKPNEAPFSVTKDGIVTLKRLRIEIDNGSYEEVTLNNFKYAKADEDVYDWSQLFAKLKFQTVRSIRQNTANGRVTIRVSNNSGGTSSWSFNTAASVKLGYGTWSGATQSAYATYKARCYYLFGSSEVNVEEKETAFITASWGTMGAVAKTSNTITIDGHYYSEPYAEGVQLIQFSLSTSIPSTWSAHKKTISVNCNNSAYSSTNFTVLNIQVNASDEYINGAESVYLKAASTSLSANTTLDYGEKYMVRSYYVDPYSSQEMETGVRDYYVIAAPTQERAYNNGAKSVVINNLGSTSLSANTTLSYGSKIVLRAQYTPYGTSNTANVASYVVQAPKDNGGINSIDCYSGILSQFTITAKANSGATKTKTFYLSKTSGRNEVVCKDLYGTVVGKVTWS